MKLFASDLHGTIVFNDEGTRRAVNGALESMGLEGDVSLQLIREAMGLPWSDYFTSLFPDAEEGDIKTFVGTVRELSRLYENRYERLMYHAADVLAEIKSMGYRVAVVSISTRPAIERSLNRHGLSNLVDDVLGVDESMVGGYDIAWHKSRQLREYIQRMDADRSIMIGDREEDVAAGLSAGAMTIYFNRSGRSNPRAMYSVKDWREVLPLV